MPEYRRSRIEGATYFITLVTHNRYPIFRNPQSRKFLRDAWMHVKNRFPFTTNAVCLLPDHIHTLITLPENDSNYSIRIREIKRIFTKSYLELYSEPGKRNTSRKNKKEATVWQRRFWEHTIRDEVDLRNHLDYIHFNPVKHGLVNNVAAWRWSSFHRYVREGYYDIKWGENVEPLIKADSAGE